jgi:uncharacterized protein with PQ loop repeat
VEKTWLTRFDNMMVIAGLISPLATIPQIVKLFATHSEHAAGQSLTTWLAYTVIALLWVVYGVLNRQRAVLVGNALGTAVYGAMAFGIMLQAGITF